MEYRTSLCKNCRQYFNYTQAVKNGRRLEYCDNCRADAKRKLARERKRKQRAVQSRDTTRSTPPPLLEGGEKSAGKGGGGLSPLVPRRRALRRAIVELVGEGRVWGMKLTALGRRELKSYRR